MSVHDRMRAVAELEDRPRSLPKLMAATTDVSPGVARAALERISRLGGEREARVLRQQMLECDLGLVEAHAHTLASLGDTGAAIAVAKQALNNPPYVQRVAGAIALGALGSREDARSLLSALDDPIAAVRVAALRAHVQLDPAATHKWCVRLLTDEDPVVRTLVVQICTTTPVIARVDLSPAARDSVTSVRRAVSLHAYCLDKDSVAILLHDRESLVRRGAAATAGTNAVELLAEVLRDEPIVGIRQSAAQRLGDLGDPAAQTALFDALAAHDSILRVAALRSLERLLGRDQLVVELQQRLYTQPVENRVAALFALARLDAVVSDSVIKQLISDPDQALRQSLVETAAVISTDPQALLETLMQDVNPEVRHSAEVHLLQLKNR